MSNEQALIIGTSAACGLAAGFLMHRSDFCVAGMFRDLFLFRRLGMLRALVLLVVLSMALFEGARVLGLVAYHPFPLLGPASLGNLAGGLLFGVGMVLAGGCVAGILYKMGAGSALAMVAFAGLLAGSALYAEIHPQWAAFSASLAVFGPAITLPEAFGLAPWRMVAPLAAVGALVVWHWFRNGRFTMPSHVEGYLQPWRAAAGLALIGLVSYLVVGMPLGITTAYAKLGAAVESLVAPKHVAGLAYFATTPLRYRPPLGGTEVSGGPGPELDGIAAIQYPLIVGVVLGATLSALLLGELAIRFRAPARQYASVLAGGLLLGLAARMVPACNVWHLWGGLPILAGQSLLFLAGLLPGAWLGSRILVRWVIVGSGSR